MWRQPGPVAADCLGVGVLALGEAKEMGEVCCTLQTKSDTV